MLLSIKLTQMCLFKVCYIALPFSPMQPIFQKPSLQKVCQDFTSKKILCPKNILQTQHKLPKRNLLNKTMAEIDLIMNMKYAKNILSLKQNSHFGCVINGRMKP